MPAACAEFTAEELACALAEQRGRAEDLLTLAAALQSKLPGTRAALRDGSHEGTRRYEELYDLVYRREASQPNEIWQADHTQLDLWVIAPSGRPARPWLTIVEDDHSRAVAGYGLNLGAPSALNTRWRSGRRSGARSIRTGTCAGSRPRSTSTMAPISPPGTWSR